MLVVDDEPALARALGINLRAHGYDVLVVGTGRAALTEAGRAHPDVIVLDLGLPDTDGTELCRQIRAETACYVLMLTARAEEVDLLIGLAVGADGYMAKPFSPRELVARVQALLRRPRIPSVIIETHHALDFEEAARWKEERTLEVFAAAVAQGLVDALSSPASSPALAGTKAGTTARTE